MPTEPKHHEPPAEHEVLLRVLERAGAFLRKNGLHLAAAALVLVLGAVLFRTHRYRRDARSNQAWELLGTVGSPAYLTLYEPERAAPLREDAIAKLTAALEAGPDADATPWLLLKLGGFQAAGEQWDAALASYARILEGSPDSAAAACARSARAVVLENAGRYAEAAAAYEELAAESPSYWLAAGRCHELAGERSAAEAAYRRAIDGDAPEESQAMAEARLAALQRGELLGPPPPEPKPEPEPEPQPPADLLVPADTPTALGTPAAAPAVAEEGADR